MKLLKLKLILNATALVFTAVSFNPVFAQMNMDHGKMNMAAMPGMTDGEVRRIDKDAGKITIKHGEIKHMEMPGMTMVFSVKDRTVLEKIEVGQNVQFMVVRENGKMIITDIQMTK